MHTLDNIDRQIIALLNENGRMPSAEIARRLDSTPARTVSHRIESLIERGIIEIKAVVNPKAVGYHVLADVLIEVEPGRVREVAEKIAQFAQVSYVACATGDRDVSVQLLARDNEELFNFVTECLGNIPGVRRTETHLLPFKVKDIDSWLPPDMSITPQAGSDGRPME